MLRRGWQSALMAAAATTPPAAELTTWAVMPVMLAATHTPGLGQTRGVGGNEFTSAERVRGGVQSEAGQHLGTGDEPRHNR